MDCYKKILKFIKGYLIIPLWIILFFGTTFLLILLTINAWISQKIFRRRSIPQFNQRSIFPYEN